MSKPIQKAIFAAGCFWGIEVKFRKLKGVISTQVGYTGGHIENPTYDEVCSGLTGHAEAVEIEFNSDEISYEDLLIKFFNYHDSTTLNQQGVDIGTQYRSAIFYSNDSQKDIAVKIKKEFSGKFDNPIVTEILPAKKFYKAEEYHQQYYEKTGREGCGF